MDDEFLKNYQQAPRPEFARQLQDKLNGGTNMLKQKTWRHNVMRWSPALIAATLVLALALVIALPPARALAQDFLNLFRVKKFAALTIDPARMKQLDNLDLDTEKLLADDVEILQKPGEPTQAASVQEASERAGFTVAVPSAPSNAAPSQILVQGAGAFVLTADTQKLQELLEIAGIHDAQVPAQLNGAKITVRKPAAVVLTYKLQRAKLTLIQSPSPEVELPQGVELKQLGEIGLRVLGLSQADAHNFAQNVDWSSTFLVPIPANAAEVRQVNVNGAEGLMINASATAQNRRSPYAEGDTLILWANNGMVYALQGSGAATDLLELASSVQ